MDKYLKLVELQANCEFLTLEKSIQLTEYVKSGNVIDASIMLLELITNMEVVK